MDRPGKYVLIKKVNSSSKAIQKVKNGKNKTIEKKLKKQLQPQNSKPVDAVQKKNNQQVTQPLSKSAKRKLKKKNKLNDASHQEVSSKKNKTEAAFAANKKEKLKAKHNDFQEDLADRLKASRFRFINEELYTRRGDDAFEIFNEDESAFTTYHEGYRKQVEYWPINPLDRIINSVKKLLVFHYEKTFSYMLLFGIYCTLSIFLQTFKFHCCRFWMWRSKIEQIDTAKMLQLRFGSSK